MDYHDSSANLASQKIIPIICHCQCTERYAGGLVLCLARSILAVNLSLCGLRLALLCVMLLNV
jgi:hypothetical protein